MAAALDRVDESYRLHRNEDGVRPVRNDRARVRRGLVSIVPGERPVWTAPEFQVTLSREGSSGYATHRVPENDGDEVLAGSGEVCGIVLPGPAGERHARFFRHRGRLLVEDLRSPGGVKLNGVPLAGPSELAHGDVLELAGSTIRYVCYWDVLVRPVPKRVRESIPSEPAPNAVPEEIRRPVRPAPAPAPPPSRWEENAKIIALAVLSICCLAVIMLLLRL
ncbi:MAG: FHA domain-containing protein [Phycisphaerae bacterium]|nr:FHA domain-containing protein [Phycisphaerae bacterium]